MGEKGIETLSQLIPEFYFDVIARIVPGALTITGYGWDSLGRLQSLGDISLGVLCSYFVGLLIDVTSDILLGRVVFRWVLPGVNAVVTDPLIPDLELWPSIRRLSDAQIVVFNKMMAEKAMLRGVILVNLIAIFYPPSVVPRTNGLLIVLVSLAVLLFCYFSLQAYVSGRIRDAATIPVIDSE